ncbi:MAG: PSD1 and planctomycete cytochrome C domain-containing protein [Pirellulales bacterium]
MKPIFAARCVACHGAKKHEGGLRLDRGADALRGGDSGAAIVAGKSGESELFARVTSDDDDLRMPQEGKPLSASEIDVLRRWIDAGAAWPESADDAAKSDHWAFHAPRPPDLPDVRRPDWARGAIDRFVLSRLDREQIEPSSEADRLSLCRRVYLDLTGLPPTVAEADAFAADTTPDAYERLVDRLLASPAYGERWARRWLDLARYSDTNGYEKDRPRSIWPYRDWVIRSLNADMPFDEFTVKQIAGDMLPDATVDDRIATGFHRNTMINEEGGIDVEEFRFAAMIDRVATTGTVWLGLTLGCAQCHSHKFDPITQREYYGFFALLNNADELDMPVPDERTAARRAELLARITSLENSRAAKFPMPADAGQDRETYLAEQQAKWEHDAAAGAVDWQIVRPASMASQGHATMTTLDNGSVLVSGDKPNYDTYVVELTTDLPRVTALRLEVLPHESLPDDGPGRAPLFSVGDFLLSEVEIEHAAGKDAKPERVAIAAASHSFAQQGRDARLAIDGELDTGWSIQGRTGEAHRAVFRLAEPITVGAGGRIVVTLAQRYIHQMTIGRFRLSLTADDGEIKASTYPAEVEAALLIPAERRAADERDILRRHWLSVAPQLAKANEEIAALRKQMPRFTTTMVLEERTAAHVRMTHVHGRGEFLRPTDPAEPGVPAALHPLSSHVANGNIGANVDNIATPDRLDLARWLVDPANPLVARVAMNRQWEALFGRGLVRTVENLGTQADKPTHPQLLDWLACEFVAQGWSRKAMHRALVASATYRQSSRVSPQLATRDRDNELLARGPRVRLEAEMVRDVALSAAGLLSRKIGGPSVYPPQPDGVTALAYGGAAWPTSQGEDRYRRGLYAYSKRTAPYAAFALFDAPSGETTCPRRERSNTPLQALTTLNDAVFVEAAVALGRRAESEGPADAVGKARWLFREILTRTPTDEELRAIVGFHAAQQAHAADATAGPPKNRLDPWAAAARALLNLDEFVTRP